jgi:Flp pilus assembly pilin Flp
MLRKLTRDESGAVLSTELVLISSLLVIGLIVGLTELRDSIANELNDVGEAVGALNQSYSVSGQSGRGWGTLRSRTSGSFFVDGQDRGDGNESMISCDWPQREFAPKSPLAY